MEHHSTTHYLSWKLHPSTNSFRPPPFFQESFVWPPRSYSCSFCRREFRSAQALGGHMNVHRRDRARLKQSPPPLQAEARIKESSRIYAAENSLARTLPNEEESGRRSAKHAGGDDECVSDGDGDGDGDEFVETNVVCKRHKLCSSERCSSMAEEIDLELRLGAPAFKIGQIS